MVHEIESAPDRRNGWTGAARRDNRVSYALDRRQRPVVKSFALIGVLD
jgi:hypothetical protein